MSAQLWRDRDHWDPRMAVRWLERAAEDHAIDGLQWEGVALRASARHFTARPAEATPDAFRAVLHAVLEWELDDVEAAVDEVSGMRGGAVDPTAGIYRMGGG